MRRFLARAIYHPTLAYNVFLGRGLRLRRWWDYVDDQIILGAMPFRRDTHKLKELGVTGVVNMCEEYPGPKVEYGRLGIEQLWLPTTDFHHPAAEHVELGANFIEQHVQADGKVYVHCKAGRARSATIVCWWFVKYRGLTPAAAQAKMLAARPHVNPNIHLRPVIQELYAALSPEADQNGGS
ncbi:MAG: dual specificity protein phosphatase family protein [Pirellulaceae bacterium]